MKIGKLFSSEFLFGSRVLSVLLLYALTVIGWVANIVKLAHMDGEITVLFALRIVGIFAFPLGAVLGLLA